VGDATIAPVIFPSSSHFTDKTRTPVPTSLALNHPDFKRLRLRLRFLAHMSDDSATSTREPPFPIPKTQSVSHPRAQ